MHVRKSLFGFGFVFLMLFLSVQSFQPLVQTNNPITTNSSSKLDSLNSISVLHQFQQNLNFSSNLLDAALFTTEFSTTSALLISYQFDSLWTYTTAGNIIGQGVNSSMLIPQGTNNISVFFGLGLLLKSNVLNTLVNGTIKFSFSIRDPNNFNITLNSLVTFPTMNFSFNSSKISSRINNTRVFSSTQTQFLNRMSSNIVLNFTRTASNTGYIILAGGDIGGHALFNGSVGMQVDGYSDGFSVGRVFDTLNNSFTSSDVPVGYPFSVLRLPANLTFNEFKSIFNYGFYFALNSYQPLFYNTSTHYSISFFKYMSSGILSLQMIYDISSGALLYSYVYNSFSPASYEKLVLVNSTIVPLNAPQFVTLDHNQATKNITVNWQSEGSGVNYSLSLNGAEIANLNKTSFSFNVSASGLYTLELRAINTTSGFISTVSTPLLVNVTLPSTGSTSTPSSSTPSSSSSSTSSSVVSSYPGLSKTSSSSTVSLGFAFGFPILALLTLYVFVHRKKKDV